MKIAGLISGGVDSSVAVYRLKEMGYTPSLFYIKIGPDKDTEWNCTSEEDLEMATAVAHKYGCTLEVVDCHKDYWEKVVGYTMEKVKNGLTPNPDVMCNRLIKFGCFEEKVGYEFDYIATGHYATTTEKDGLVWLSTSPDPVKDQTDFLAQITYLQVKKLMFPVGRMLKHEVREIAEREHLINAKRRDSQGICFLGNINYNDYIAKYLGEKRGDIIEFETGKKIGEHKGIWFHTIGQRHGLGLGGGPWFVVKKDAGRNVIYVSKGYDPATAYKSEFRMKDFHFITKNPWQTGVPVEHPITFKIRHTPEFNKGLLVMDGDEYLVKSERPIHGVAPGQFGVIYDEVHHLCYGSGEITL